MNVFKEREEYPELNLRVLEKIVEFYGIPFKLVALSESKLNELEQKVKIEAEKNLNRIDYKNTIEYFQELEYSFL